MITLEQQIDYMQGLVKMAKGSNEDKYNMYSGVLISLLQLSEVKAVVAHSSAKTEQIEEIMRIEWENDLKNKILSEQDLIFSEMESLNSQMDFLKRNRYKNHEGTEAELESMFEKKKELAARMEKLIEPSGVGIKIQEVNEDGGITKASVEKHV